MAPVNSNSTIDRIYDELAYREIRLIKLLPGGGQDEIKVHLHSIVIDESDLWPYEALSYTWTGDECKIYCDGIPFNTTENLRDALLQIRLPSKSKYLWADQICINQTDPDEKEMGQLPLLPEIYSRAQRVLIWLGKQDETSDRAMACFPRLIAELLDSTVNEDQVVKTSAEYDTQEMRGLHCLLTRRWFSRVWTLQEVAVARKATIICGSWTLPWHKLEYFNDMCQTDTTGRWTNLLLAISVESDSTTEEALNARFVTTHIHFISRLRASLTVTQAGKPLSSNASLLTQVRTCRATFPKDKVLSILKFLTPELKAALVSLRNGIGLNTEKFYHEIAKFEIVECLDMNYIGAAGLRQRSYGNSTMPSWVPDWTVVLYNHELWYLNQIKMDQAGEPLYQASKTKEPHAKVKGASDELLQIQARITGTINDTAEPFRWTITTDHGPPLMDDDYEGKLRKMTELNQERCKSINLCLEMAESCRPHYGKSFDSACHQTFVAGLMQVGQGSTKGGTQRRATDDELNQLYAAYFDAMKVFASDSLLETTRRATRAMQAGLFPAADDLALMMSYKKAGENILLIKKLTEHMQDACKRRVFFITEEGYIGLGPHGLDTAKVGDKICVIHGCCTPFVIRPVNAYQQEEQYYELIGEAYVHGLMDGEAMDMSHIEDQKIILR